MPQFFILASRENKIAKKQNEMGKKGGQEKITQRTLYTNIIKKTKEIIQISTESLASSNQSSNN